MVRRGEAEGVWRNLDALAKVGSSGIVGTQQEEEPTAERAEPYSRETARSPGMVCVTMSGQRLVDDGLEWRKIFAESRLGDQVGL